MFYEFHTFFVYQKDLKLILQKNTFIVQYIFSIMLYQIQWSNNFSFRASSWK